MSYTPDIERLRQESFLDGEARHTTAPYYNSANNMMTTTRTASGRQLCGAWTRLAALTLLAANLAVAQATNSTAAPTDDKVLKLESYQVTGSYLPAAANSVAIPVIAIDRNTIAIRSKIPGARVTCSKSSAKPRRNSTATPT
jgi:hypothetical protein